MSALDKPNVVLPLAESYQERGVNGYTTTVTSGIDQRKINSIYEPIKNTMTGKGTLYLVKRPGARYLTPFTFGSSGQVAYLAVLPRTLSVLPWVFSTSGSDVRASDGNAASIIFTSAGYWPAYVDLTAVGGTETVVMQASNATGSQRVWFASAYNSWTEITDADFTALTKVGKMEFMDGFAFIMDSATNRLYNSDIGSLSAWTATSFLTKQIKQDKTVGLMKFKNQIISFGFNTAEIFFNAGNTTGSPLSTIPQLAANIGMYNPGSIVVTGSTHYYAISADTAYFVGVQNNQTSFFSYNGSSFQKISTPAIDKILIGALVAQTIYSVNSLNIKGRAAVAISLTATTATTQRWLIFFPDWNEWFEWDSTTFTPVNTQNLFLGVGTNQHKLYQLSLFNIWQDDSVDYTMTHQFVLPADGNERKFMPLLALKGDTATSAQSILVEKSDDDYASFQTLGNIDMTSTQKKLYRCGSWQGHRAIRLSHTGNTEVRLESFLARIE